MLPPPPPRKKRKLGMTEEIIWLNVEDLGIDAVNIRGGKWDYDQDFVRDIKNNGINSPLLVRPADPSSGVKHTIVCGSRRYFAAMKADRTTVPCLIEEFDDITAMGRSIAENKHRKDIPAWRYALQIGEMYQKLSLEGKKSKIVKIIMQKTGLSENTVYDYFAISTLPVEVIELMKEPAKRSEKVKELLAKFSTVTVEKLLAYDKAARIARQLAPDCSLEKTFEVAAYVIPLIREVAFEIIERVKTYPKKSIKEVHDMVMKIPRGATCSLEFSSHTVMGLDEACAVKDTDRKSLVIYYLEEGLKRDGYSAEKGNN